MDNSTYRTKLIRFCIVAVLFPSLVHGQCETVEANIEELTGSDYECTCTNLLLIARSTCAQTCLECFFDEFDRPVCANRSELRIEVGTLTRNEISYRTTVEYAEGTKNEATILVTKRFVRPECTVSKNSVECSSCQLEDTADGDETCMILDCSNLPGEGVYNECSSVFRTGTDDTILFAAFGTSALRPALPSQVFDSLNDLQEICPGDPNPFLLFPTSAPTRNPFLFPPTPAPTLFPTVPPSLRPTPTPTRNPTLALTQSPTRSPTANPTSRPTFRPTEQPNETPTETPTRTSLQPPAAILSEIPTQQPGENLTLAPSVGLVPTQVPTRAGVTVNLTETPSQAPEDAQTTTPSVSLGPTQVPTGQVDKIPPLAPSTRPVQMFAPTSQVPTERPSPGQQEPTGMPTRIDLPTVTPVTPVSNASTDLVTSADTPLEIFPPSPDVVSSSVEQDPANGEVTIDLNHVVTYTPRRRFVGVDAFTVKYCDIQQVCQVKDFTVKIIGSTEPPSISSGNKGSMRLGSLTLAFPVMMLWIQSIYAKS